MKTKIILIILAVIAVLIILSLQLFNKKEEAVITEEITATPTIISDEIETSIVAENLDTPWGIAFLPNNDILVTERPGRVRIIEANGQMQFNPIAVLGQVKEAGEGGLLGIAVHPNFYNPVFSYVYLYYTYHNNRLDTLNRVVRMKYDKRKLIGERILLDGIPGSTNHNGGRLKFGPDGYLYITTGDAENPSQSQDRNSLAGKILRITDEGEIPADNPFGNAVYSYGHRNSQGLAWDREGKMFATEHGRSNPSGFDEINFIEKGRNYGWPVIQGDEVNNEMVAPLLHSGTDDTWAPGGAEFAGSSLFFGGLAGKALFEAVIQSGEVKNFNVLLKDEFGRIRDVIKGPDGLLYITTSNQDGRATPEANDDRIIRVKPVIKVLE